jgi:hypothetical protein
MPVEQLAEQIVPIRVVAAAELADITGKVGQAVLMPVTILMTALLLLAEVGVVVQEGLLEVAEAAELAYLV